MTKYGPLITAIRDQHGYGMDVYPKTLASGYDMLENCARNRKLFPTKRKPKINAEKLRDTEKKDVEKESDTGVMYSQDGIVPGTNDKVYSQIKCHGCGEFGNSLSH